MKKYTLFHLYIFKTILLIELYHFNIDHFSPYPHDRNPRSATGRKSQDLLVPWEWMNMYCLIQLKIGYKIYVEEATKLENKGWKEPRQHAGGNPWWQLRTKAAAWETPRRQPAIH